MNSISWFLYASDVVGNLQPTLAIGGGSGLVAAGFFTLCSFIDEDNGGISLAKRISFYAIPAILIACIIPSKTTMYAIAASQVGERVAQNEAVQDIASDATKALQIWIKKQIEPEAKKQ